MQPFLEGAWAVIFVLAYGRASWWSSAIYSVAVATLIGAALVKAGIVYAAMMREVRADFGRALLAVVFCPDFILCIAVSVAVATS
jgi:hypothetical protein